MNKFLCKSLKYYVPFLAIYMIIRFLPLPEGSLYRTSHFIDYTPNYRDSLPRFNIEKKSYIFSDLKHTKKRNFNILTFGDSFSKQGKFGYQNFLALKGYSVLHFNSNTNAIQTAYSIINGNTLDSINIEYIIVEFISRWGTMRSQNINYRKELLFEDLSNLEKPYEDYEEIINSDRISRKILFRRQIVTLPLMNFFKEFDDNSFISKTYAVPTTIDLFTARSKNNELLFYSESLDNLRYTNDYSAVNNMTKELNKLNAILKKRNITLIVLVVPTKYEVYYEYIQNKNKYRNPEFFEHYNKTDKKYINIPSKATLTKAIKRQIKDIYYYDDDHWSPIGAEIISTIIDSSIIYHRQNEIKKF